MRLVVVAGTMLAAFSLLVPAFVSDARGQAGARGGTISGIDSEGRFLLDGRVFFPIALSKPPPRDGTTPSGADRLDEVVGAGVNLLKVGPTGIWTDADIAEAKAWDSAALSRGAHTWVNLMGLARATPHSSQEAVLRKVVTSLRDDPSGRGLGLWKGADEPWWSGYSPASLQFAYCLVTGRGDPSWCAGEQPLDRDHLWVTIEAPKGTASDLAPYSAVTDVHGVDVYPVALGVADPDLHRVGVWTHTILSITPDRAVWTTLQICFSGSYRNGAYVLPTRLQERYMIYDAIVNGARALNFYGGNIPGCWSSSDEAHSWNWTFWTTTLKSLVEEINARSPLAPVLLRPDSTRPLQASDSTTEVISRDDGKGDLWVLAARSGAGTAEVTVSGLPKGITSGSVYGEDRTIAVADGSFTDSFSQWGVHVYEFAHAVATG